MALWLDRSRDWGEAPTSSSANNRTRAGQGQGEGALCQDACGTRDLPSGEGVGGCATFPEPSPAAGKGYFLRVAMAFSKCPWF